MPEASVYKYRYFEAGPREIRLPGDGPVFAVASQTGGEENPGEGNFGRLVASRFYRGHNPGPNVLRDVVHAAYREE